MESHQDHNKELQSFHTYRTLFTELSIQDLHIFNHLRPNGGNGPHNSQINKLENGTLNPKKEIFDSLHSMNQEIDKEDKFLYIPQERIRSRLKKAPAYLNHEGKVATKKDFLLIFHGLQPVNDIYQKILTITVEDIKQYGALCFNFFQDIKRSNFLEPKEAWNLFLDQPYSKSISKNDLNIINDLLRGEDTLTEEVIMCFGSTYGRCPVIPSLQSMSDIKTPKELIESNYKIENYVASKLKANLAKV